MATANMLLTLPTVGVTAGPAYASQINAALEVVDRHDHSTGSGVQITPAGLNINADLSFNENDATDLRTARFTSQPSALTGASPDLACLYVVADDLYYNDGAGNQIALTIGGSIAGATGNITGLVAPAAVTYTSGGSPNYKFISTATESANIDAASYLMRNPGVTATYALTLQAPTLSNNYSITLPALPGAASFLQIDSSGVITAAPAIALGITAANLATDAVTTTKIADLNVTNAKIANSTITAGKMAFTTASGMVITTYTGAGTSNFVVPTGITTLIVRAIGGGGGGGAGGNANAGGNRGDGGGAGAGGSWNELTVPVTAGETVTITRGAGGTAGAISGSALGNGAAGGAGGDTVVSSTTMGTLTFKGGAGGAGGVGGIGSGGVSAPAAGGAGGWLTATGFNAAGGRNGQAAGAGGQVAGTATMFAAGGTVQGINPDGGAGGGGGAGFAAGGAGGTGSGGTGSSGTSGAGGGGGGGGFVSNAGPGGAGGAGVVYIAYVALN